MSTILIVDRNGKNMKRARDLMDSWLRKFMCISNCEPPRDSRRLHILRGWSHEHIEEVFT